MAQRQATVVEEVNNLDRENGAEEGCVGQGSGTQGFGKGADVRTQEAEPLMHIKFSSCFSSQGYHGQSEELTATKRIGRLAAMTSMKNIEKTLLGYWVGSRKIWLIWGFLP